MGYIEVQYTKIKSAPANRSSARVTARIPAVWHQGRVWEEVAVHRYDHAGSSPGWILFLRASLLKGSKLITKNLSSIFIVCSRVFTRNTFSERETKKWQKSRSALGTTTDCATVTFITRWLAFTFPVANARKIMIDLALWQAIIQSERAANSSVTLLWCAILLPYL